MGDGRWYVGASVCRCVGGRWAVRGGDEEAGVVGAAVTEGALHEDERGAQTFPRSILFHDAGDATHDQ